MSKYHDDRTVASDPVQVKLSSRKLKMFQDQLSVMDRFIYKIIKIFRN